MRRLSFVLAVLAAGTVASGCAPRLGPPYRDYEVRAAGADLTAELAAAAQEAGWTLAESRDPEVVSTQPQRVADGVTSHTEAALDLVPLAGGHVRVYVRAERRSIFGSRAKVYALDDGLRRAVLGPISEALRARGLVPLGTPRDRDEDATDGD